jgi:hypothetical protein
MARDFLLASSSTTMKRWWRRSIVLYIFYHLFFCLRRRPISVEKESLTIRTRLRRSRTSSLVIQLLRSRMLSCSLPFYRYLTPLGLLNTFSRLLNKLTKRTRVRRKSRCYEILLPGKKRKVII